MHDDTTNSALLRRLLYGCEEDARRADSIEWVTLPAIALGLPLLLCMAQSVLFASSQPGNISRERVAWCVTVLLLFFAATILPHVVILRQFAMQRSLADSGLWEGLRMTGRSRGGLEEAMHAALAYRPVAYSKAVFLGLTLWWLVNERVGLLSSLGVFALLWLNMRIGIGAGFIAWRRAMYLGRSASWLSAAAAALSVQVGLLVALSLFAPRWVQYYSAAGRRMYGSSRRSLGLSLGWTEPGHNGFLRWRDELEHVRYANGVSLHFPTEVFVLGILALLVVTAGVLIAFRWKFSPCTNTSDCRETNRRDALHLGSLALGASMMYLLARTENACVVTLQVGVAVVQHGVASLMLWSMMRDQDRFEGTSDGPAE